MLLVTTATGCGGEGEEAAGPAVQTLGSSTTTTAPATTTTVVEGPIAPLTGEVTPAGTDIGYPALAVKIDNHELARPQVGLEQADLVFDLRAEGVTRFVAVYHAELPETIGPVRSSRTSDFDLLRGLDHPLYGSSGGNENVMAGLSSVPAYAVTNQTRREYFRDDSRPAPHNLFIDPDDLYALAPEDATTPPEPWFAYRAPETEPPVPPEGELTVDFAEGPTVGFSWDGEVGGWRRTQDGEPHVTSSGAQLAPENVVIMVTSYGSSPADPRSPEVVSTGSGDLVVLTGGQVIEGTWERPDATDKPTLLDGNGEPILLTPGQTWVLYPEAGQVQ